jgi:hypothetical protein
MTKTKPKLINRWQNVGINNRTISELSDAVHKFAAKHGVDPAIVKFRNPAYYGGSSAIVCMTPETEEERIKREDKARRERERAEKERKESRAREAAYVVQNAASLQENKNDKIAKAILTLLEGDRGLSEKIKKGLK